MSNPNGGYDPTGYGHAQDGTEGYPTGTPATAPQETVEQTTVVTPDATVQDTTYAATGDTTPTQAFAATSDPYATPAAQEQAAPQYGAYATAADANPYATPATDTNPYAAPAGEPYGAAPAYGTQEQYAGGYAQAAAYQQATRYIPRYKVLAGLLAFFFGALGIHNFYLGYTGKAIAQVLLTCLGWIAFGLGPIAAIVWAIVEGVQILTSDYGTPAHRDARGVELVD